MDQAHERIGEYQPIRSQFSDQDKKALYSEIALPNRGSEININMLGIFDYHSGHFGDQNRTLVNLLLKSGIPVAVDAFHEPRVCETGVQGDDYSIIGVPDVKNEIAGHIGRK